MNWVIQQTAIVKRWVRLRLKPRSSQLFKRLLGKYTIDNQLQLRELNLLYGKQEILMQFFLTLILMLFEQELLHYHLPSLFLKCFERNRKVDWSGQHTLAAFRQQIEEIVAQELWSLPVYKKLNWVGLHCIIWSGRWYCCYFPKRSCRHWLVKHRFRSSKSLLDFLHQSITNYIFYSKLSEENSLEQVFARWKARNKMYSCEDIAPEKYCPKTNY
jgi:hypothetical protein